MTRKTGGQKVIEYRPDIQDCIDQIYDYYKEADFIDCRMNAFPFNTEYSIDLQIKNRTPADFFMIDLDLKDFDYSNEKLNKTMRRTVKKLYKSFHYDSNPTVLWTGNGYHIYQPLSGLILEKENVFFDFVKYIQQKDLTSEFLRFVGPYFTDSKNDKQHLPSIRSCLVRIPGTFNSKNMQEIKVIKEWSGTRPAINYILRDYRRYLIQKRISTKTEKMCESRSSLHNKDFSKIGTKDVIWIEKLLNTPINDYRKLCLWWILIPYLVNIKMVGEEEVFLILVKWIKACDKIRSIDFDYRNVIKWEIKRVKNFRPISFDDLKKDYPYLYEKVHRI